MVIDYVQLLKDAICLINEGQKGDAISKINEALQILKELHENVGDYLSFIGELCDEYVNRDEAVHFDYTYTSVWSHIEGIQKMLNLNRE